MSAWRLLPGTTMYYKNDSILEARQKVPEPDIRTTSLLFPIVMLVKHLNLCRIRKQKKPLAAMSELLLLDNFLFSFYHPPSSPMVWPFQDFWSPVKLNHYLVASCAPTSHCSIWGTSIVAVAASAVKQNDLRVSNCRANVGLATIQRMQYVQITGPSCENWGLTL